MKQMKIIYIAFICFFTLAACNQDTEEGKTGKNQNQQPNVEQIKNQKDTITQQPSKKAKRLLSQFEEITEIHAVNTKHTLLVTVEIEHHERFTLKKKQKQYQKLLEQEFKGEHVEVSTDKKIVIETKELEKQVKENKLTQAEINKEMDRIIRFSREQT